MGAIKTAADLTASNFAFKDNYIAAEKTTSPHNVAHPDNTLLMAGLARLSASAQVDKLNELKFIGAANSVTLSESQTVQPLKELGSSRHIMTTTNNPVTIGINTLLINGPNLLKALYSSAISAGLTGFDVQQFKVLLDENYGGFANLDYPIFSVPFGLAIISRTVASKDIQAVYAEVCLVQSWNYQIQAGQSTVFTTAQLIADRVLPIQFSSPDDSNAIHQLMNTLSTGSPDGIPENTPT